MSARLRLAGWSILGALLLGSIALGPSSPLFADEAADIALQRAATPIQADVVAPRPPVTTTTAAPTTTTVKPTTTTTQAPKPKPKQRFTLTPYKGLGVWLDVYDWSITYAKHSPSLDPTIVDWLAGTGVQTIFIQASKWDSSTAVVDRDLLMAYIDRAHKRGLTVVGWYLPTLEDPARDLRRLRAIADLPVDGLAVDIEATNIDDIAERNRRIVAISRQLRASLPGEVIGAIPLEPVLIEDVNPRYWPAFPWAELAPSYDVWMPMTYWTNRRGGWRDAYVYTTTNIDRVRERLGDPKAKIHALGGIGDLTSVVDLQLFRLAADERHVIGGSIYDFRTTQSPHWSELLPFRVLRK